MTRQEFEELLKTLKGIKVYHLDAESEVLNNLYAKWNPQTVAQNF